MELLLFLISMACIVLLPSIRELTLRPLHPSNQCCDGSLLSGLQCHCWDHSSVRPFCAQPCESSGFSSIPLGTHDCSRYRGSYTQPLSSCLCGYNEPWWKWSPNVLQLNNNSCILLIKWHYFLYMYYQSNYEPPQHHCNIWSVCTSSSYGIQRIYSLATN